MRLDAFDCGSMEEFISLILTPSCIIEIGDANKATTMWVSLSYTIWKARNEKVHVEKWRVENVIACFEIMAYEHCQEIERKAWEKKKKTKKSTNWSPPASGWIKINIDGATCRGKNAFTMIACDCQGKTIFASSVIRAGLPSRLAELRAVAWATGI